MSAGNTFIGSVGSNGLSPPLVLVATSFVSYLIYKRYEPQTVPANAVLLLLVPAALQIEFTSYIPGVIPRLFAVSVLYWISILSFIVAYRLSPIHPLAKFPGPILPKISRFWMVYHIWRGDAYKYLIQWHSRYGDAVRIGPNELSFRRPDLVEPILASKVYPKGPFYETRISETGMQLDGIRDFHEHGLRRKPWNKGLSITAINGYKEIVQNKTQKLVTLFSRRSGDIMDISACMSYFAFDIMGQMTYSRDFGMLEKADDADGLWHLTEVGIVGIGILSQIPWVLDFLKYLPGWDRDVKKLQKFGRECANARMQNGSPEKDMIYYLIGEDGSEKSIITPEMAATDGMLAIIAGSDTTATTMSHFWYFMMMHPEYLARLREEIEANFPNGEEPNDPGRHARMPYLNACINEAMRLYPPVLGGLQRMVDRGTEGAMLGDWYVPPATQISVNHYSVQRDPREFYPLPDTFWPDRWLEQEAFKLPTGETIPKDSLVLNKAAFIPFSVGPQSCPGKNLALLELRLMICAIASKFDMELAPGFTFGDWIDGLHDSWVSTRGPLLVRLTTRGVKAQA